MSVLICSLTEENEQQVVRHESGPLGRGAKLSLSSPNHQTNNSWLFVAPPDGGRDMQIRGDVHPPQTQGTKALPSPIRGLTTGCHFQQTRPSLPMPPGPIVHSLWSRRLAAAVTGVRIEELFEICEAKGRELLFVPIPCRLQGFEIAHNPCARWRVQIAVSGRPQNAI